MLFKRKGSKLVQNGSKKGPNRFQIKAQKYLSFPSVHPTPFFVHLVFFVGLICLHFPQRTEIVFFFRCLGSTQHLKNKYGGGYILDIKCKDHSSWDDLHGAISSIFDSNKVKLEESFANRRTYSVLQSAVNSLGQVFASLEESKFGLSFP